MNTPEEILLAEVKFLRELVSTLMKQNDRLTTPYEAPLVDNQSGPSPEFIRDHLSAIMGEETNEAIDGLDDTRQGGDSQIS